MCYNVGKIQGVVNAAGRYRVNNTLKSDLHGSVLNDKTYLPRQTSHILCRWTRGRGGGVGLSMDAFAVSSCKGLSVGKMKAKYALIAGAYFGGFQALMPLIGYYIGAQFADLITKYSHWVAFVILAIIGANMIRESFSKEKEETSASFSFKTMLPMAIATSIDALAVGVALSLSLSPDESILLPVTLIGLTTFVFSAAGVKIGNVFGDKFESKAEFAGGVILILVGLKLLLDGLGVFG